MSKIQEPQTGASSGATCNRTTPTQSVPERVGEGYVNVEVTLWLVCTVHTEAQPSRVPTACCKRKDCKKLSKKKQDFYFISFHKQICAAAAAPSGQVIHHTMHSEVCHALYLHPSKKPIQRTIKIEALLLHIDRTITVCLCQASQPSPPVLEPTWDSQGRQLFKSPGWWASLD